MNASGSFFRFLLGFLAFISLSFVITYTVASYTIAQEEHEQAAAAIQAMVIKK